MKPFHQWISDAANSVEDTATVDNKKKENKKTVDVISATKQIQKGWYNWTLQYWKKTHGGKEPSTDDEKYRFCMLYISRAFTIQNRIKVEDLFGELYKHIKYLGESE